MKLLGIFTVFVVYILFSTSCSYPDNELYITDKEDFFYERPYEKFFAEKINGFCKYTHKQDALVFNIVSYENLKTTKEGLFLTEHLKSALSNKCKSKIIPVNFEENITLSSSGKPLLNENLKNKGIKYAIIGTYKKTDFHVIVFLKLINTDSKEIEQFSTLKIRYYSPIWIRF